MNSLEIKNYENKLIAVKTGILNQINLTDKNRRRFSGSPPESFDDMVVDLENDEVLVTLDTLERTELQSINNALKRIEGGTFGICGSCDNEIERRRLKSVPDAIYCMECENSKSFSEFEL